MQTPCKYCGSPKDGQYCPSCRRYSVISIKTGAVLWSTNSHSVAWSTLTKLTAAGYAVALMG